MHVADLAAEDLQSSPLRRRFSSFLSTLRRPSTSSTTTTTMDLRLSRASLNSLGSQGGSPGSLVTSPTAGLPPAGRWGGGRRPKAKGMAGLIRASRRSTKQSSIIGQNGDIIIVKGGKIVSIRRRNPGSVHDSSPVIQQRPFPPLNANGGVGGGGGGGGRAALNGRADGLDGRRHGGGDGGVSADNNNKTADLSQAAGILPGSSDRRGSLSSEGSDSVFDDSSSNALASVLDFPADSSLEMISEERRRLLSQQSEVSVVVDRVVETSVDIQDYSAGTDSTAATATAAVAAATATTASTATAATTTPGPVISEEGIIIINSSTDHGQRLQKTADVGIIISIDEDNSILDVTPLTPQTRDRITRSDLFVDEASGAALVVPAGLRLSRSTQGLCKRSLRRLPSVEHLDPPTSLKRASSDYNVRQAGGASSSGNFLQPAPTGRRWSFGKRT